MGTSVSGTNTQTFGPIVIATNAREWAANFVLGGLLFVLIGLLGLLYFPIATCANHGDRTTHSELDLFAQAEFVAHWDKPTVVMKDDQSTPFGDDYINSLEDAYGVKLDWLRYSKSGKGTIYRDSESRGSHMPSIFVDKTNSMLYFVMTD